MTKWQNGKMTIWQNGVMGKWQDLQKRFMMGKLIEIQSIKFWQFSQILVRFQV